MKALVNDANILIDLVKLGFVRSYFDLPYEFHTTSLVLEELHDDQKAVLAPFVSAGTLEVHYPKEDEIMEIYSNLEGTNGLTDKDYSAYLRARGLKNEDNLESCIISGDKPLRNLGMKKGLEVHGHLWMFDQLVDNGHLESGLAVNTLDKLNEELNPSLGLPDEKCQKLKQKWQGHGNVPGEPKS